MTAPYRVPPYVEEGDDSPEANMWRAIHEFVYASEAYQPAHPWGKKDWRDRIDAAAAEVERQIGVLRSTSALPPVKP